MEINIEDFHSLSQMLRIGGTDEPQTNTDLWIDAPLSLTLRLTI